MPGRMAPMFPTRERCVGCLPQIGERAGGVDILVNNAADPVASQPIEEWTPELWDRALAVNLRSVFLCTQAAIPVMKQRGWGRIVNISSIGAAAGGSPGTLPYAAAKGGVETFTRGLARVLGEWSVTVNAVSPGSIATEMQSRFVTSQIHPGKGERERPGTHGLAGRGGGGGAVPGFGGGGVYHRPGAPRGWWQAGVIPARVVLT